MVWINRNKSTIFVLPLSQMAPVHWRELIYTRTSQIVELAQPRDKLTAAQRFTWAWHGWAGQELLRCTSLPLRSSLGSSSVVLKLALPRPDWLEAENLGIAGWHVIINSLKGTQVGIPFPGCWMDVTLPMSCHVARTTYIKVQQPWIYYSEMLIYNSVTSNCFIQFGNAYNQITQTTLLGSDEYFNVIDHRHCTLQSHQGPDIFTLLLSCS